MSVSYHLFLVDEFPEREIGGEIVADFQVSYLEKPPQTIFKLIRTIDELGFEVYNCIHESVVNKSGRTDGHRFDHYIGKVTFVAFLNRASKLIWVKAPKDVAKGAMRTLFKSAQVSGRQRKIDVDTLRDLLGDIQGAHITVDSSTNINSRAFFGTKINEDFRFDEALEEGKMYYAIINYPYRDEDYRIGISKECGVLITTSYLDEQSELTLLGEIKETLLDKAQELE